MQVDLNTLVVLVCPIYNKLKLYWIIVSLYFYGYNLKLNKNMELRRVQEIQPKIQRYVKKVIIMILNISTSENYLYTKTKATRLPVFASSPNVWGLLCCPSVDVSSRI